MSKSENVLVNLPRRVARDLHSALDEHALLSGSEGSKRARDVMREALAAEDGIPEGMVPEVERVGEPGDKAIILPSRHQVLKHARDWRPE